MYINIFTSSFSMVEPNSQGQLCFILVLKIVLHFVCILWSEHPLSALWDVLIFRTLLFYFHQIIHQILHILFPHLFVLLDDFNHIFNSFASFSVMLLIGHLNALFYYHCSFYPKIVLNDIHILNSVHNFLIFIEKSQLKIAFTSDRPIEDIFCIEYSLNDFVVSINISNFPINRRDFQLEHEVLCDIRCQLSDLNFTLFLAEFLPHLTVYFADSDSLHDVFSDVADFDDDWVCY